MKKLSAIILTFTFIFILCAVPVSASEMSKGIYEVPIELWHAEDEKTSFGNRFVHPTAILEINETGKFLTMAVSTDMSGIEFEYYEKGSLEGNVISAEKIDNVEIGGETFSTGFKFPLLAENMVGLKFSVPVMPMSPSARLKIDYDNAVLLETFEEETTQPTAQETTTAVPETDSTEEATSQITTTQPATTQSATVTTTQATAQASAQTTVSQDTQKEDKGGPNMLLIIVAVAAVALLSIYLTKDEKNS